MNILTQIRKFVRKNIVNHGFYTCHRALKTTKSTTKNDLENQSKKANTIRNKPIKVKKQIQKEPSILQEVLQKEESFVSNFNSSENFKQIFMPLKHDIADTIQTSSLKEKKSRKGKNNAKNLIEKIDSNNNIEEIQNLNILIDNIILGNEKRLENPINGKIICELSNENPYTSYIESFISRKSKDRRVELGSSL